MAATCAVNLSHLTVCVTALDTECLFYAFLGAPKLSLCDTKTNLLHETLRVHDGYPETRKLISLH